MMLILFWAAIGLMLFGILFNYYLVGRSDKQRGD